MRLVPELAAWAEGTAAGSLWDHLGEGGTFGHAVAVLGLCSPDLVEARGCVLLAERFDPANFATWWDQLEGRGPDIEVTSGPDEYGPTLTFSQTPA